MPVANTEDTVANTEERLLALLATLEECQAFLTDRANTETARLLSLAILELRMELHKVTDSELKALCDMIASDEPVQEQSTTRQLPPYLRLIK
ncbi:hypothetical protein [Bradyrhizobium elkanii]|uniref:hypothetical protein n=1 Tax=Bradyrhizobium elkanii TaxID=29448 RepID=UPI003518B676